MVTAQSVDATELKVEGNLKRILTPGGQESFTCRINEGLTLILKNDISWVHRSLVSNTEQILTTQEAHHKDASPDKYGIEFVAKTDPGTNSQYLLATLTVKNVEAGDDGQYICRNTEKSSSMATDSQPVDVSITHDVQKVSLSIHNRKPVTGTERIELEEGEYPVRCEAKDFSPDVDIKIAIGGVPVTGISKATQIDNALSSAANSRRYSAMAGASRLMLSSEDSGKTLSCTATATFPGARSSTASVILTVLSVQPVFHCNKNISAPVGDRYVKLTCIVEHPDVGIDKFAWVYGDSGTTIEGSAVIGNYDESSIEKLNDTHSRATLKLYIINEDSFGNYFLDVRTVKGASFREGIFLAEDTTSSASSVAPTVLIVVGFLLFSW